MLQIDAALNDWVRVVRAEFSEFPGLRLTKPQIQRLWTLDETTCDSVIATLESNGFFRRTPSGVYVRND